MDICRGSCNDLAILVLDGPNFYSADPIIVNVAITVGYPVRSLRWICSSSISASFKEASGE